MKIVLDMQGAQTASRWRGIGRYTLEAAKAIVRNAGPHDVHLALNGSLVENLVELRQSLANIVPEKNIHFWWTPGHVYELETGTRARRIAGQYIREAFLESLNPDVVHVFSMFEGLGDDAVSSIGEFSTVPTSVTIYDLIPMRFREEHLVTDLYEMWYERKIGHVRRAELWMAISEHSRQESIDLLHLPEERVINVSAGYDPQFRKVILSQSEIMRIRQKYGLQSNFVMYTGGFDPRKNVESLVRAFAQLPRRIRTTVSLVIVGASNDEDQSRLRKVGERSGLSSDELLFLGHVADSDLIALYNLSTLFVLPSWAEGFGLPVIEAMACGTAVIASNTSSLPEVAGRKDMLFNPFSVNSIRQQMERVLTDDAFREELKTYGPSRAKQFSWERTALKMWEAWEESVTIHPSFGSSRASTRARPKLAYVSPLPPVKSGIADYSAEILPELARFYEVEVITDQPAVTDPWVRANCAIRETSWFNDHATRYERIVYQFGNSPHHIHMFDLLERFPGVVVLHDFFLSSALWYAESQGYCANCWSELLYRSHGYSALRDRAQSNDEQHVIKRYPTNVSVLENAIGVIVHSRHALALVEEWYGFRFNESLAMIPLIHAKATVKRADNPVKSSAADFVVCCFGAMDATKLHHRIVAAWLNSELGASSRARLVLVGEVHGGAYGQKILDQIKASPLGSTVTVTGHVSAENYQHYLQIADVAIQLRAGSRGENSKTVLDCMAYGIPVIVSEHGSMAELPEDCVVKLPEEFSDGGLIAAVERLYDDPEERSALGLRAQKYIIAERSPRRISEAYRDQIEAFYTHGRNAIKAQLIDVVASREDIDRREDLDQIAHAIARTFTDSGSPRQLLVDISALVKEDRRTGIERVTRAVLMGLLRNPPKSFRVEPVYATYSSGYRYARKFTLELLGIEPGGVSDELIEFTAGDCFLGLDWAADIVPRHSQFFEYARAMGLSLYFVVYDLLPVRYPEWFPLELCQWANAWLEQVRLSDGALCISKAVADDLIGWLRERRTGPRRDCAVGWFHIASDIEASLPSRGMSEEFRKTVDRLHGKVVVLMVGTIEPRKGHDEVLAAFEYLWNNGEEPVLILVGKEGWMTDKLMVRIETHPQLGRHLFWFSNLTDEALLKLYGLASGVVVASHAEGFGLPIVEAAHHGLPILARNIPVFREVAGEFATFFDADDPQSLGLTIKTWLGRIQRQEVPNSAQLPRMTWDRTIEQMMSLLAEDDHPNWAKPSSKRSEEAQSSTTCWLTAGASATSEGKS